MQPSKFYAIFWICAGIFLLLYACKLPPVEPLQMNTNEPEPDTVHSIISMEINGKPWKFETPAGFLTPTTISSSATGDNFSKPVGYMGTGHSTTKGNNFIRLRFERVSNLFSFDTRWMGKLVPMHSWDYEEMSIMYVAPTTTVNAPYSPDTPRTLKYFKIRKSEYFLPGPQGNYNIYDLDSATIHSFGYSLYYSGIGNNNILYSTIQYTELDLKRRRASGTFSFGLLDKETGKELHIKNGIFQNLRYGQDSVKIP